MMGLFHKHKWKCIGWGTYDRTYGDGTWIHIYCADCGATKTKDIADFSLTQEQVNKYVLDVYGAND